MRILDEFWYGNVDPAKYDTSRCREYRELQQLILKQEDQLLEGMTEEQKELFMKYADNVSEMHSLAERILFKCSFRLGARMMIEVMEEES